MALYNGNDDFLSIDGIDFSDVRRQIDFNTTNEAADITAGSGRKWRQRAEGLNSLDMTMWIGYPTDPIKRDQVLAACKPGLHYVVYGPQGNAAGMPRFAGMMHFNGAPHTSNHEKKDARGFNVAASNADDPAAHPMSNDTF